MCVESAAGCCLSVTCCSVFKTATPLVLIALAALSKLHPYWNSLPPMQKVVKASAIALASVVTVVSVLYLIHNWDDIKDDCSFNCFE